MKVYKALIYIIFLVVSLVSVSSFAATYTNVYECNRNLSGAGVSINFESDFQRTSHGSGGMANVRASQFRNLYKFTSGVSVACLLTDEPEPEKPVVIESCDYGSKQEDMTPTVQGDWTSGVHQYNSTSYAFRIETSTDIKYACDVLHRYDVICHTDNPLAVAQFNIDLIKDFPKYNNSVQMAYQGCLYDALLTQDLDNKWDGECYNATFYRTDSPADQIGNVDFTPYACEEKTCPQGQELDEQGICQNITIQCPSGQFPKDGLCVNETTIEDNDRVYNVNACVFNYSHTTNSGAYMQMCNIQSVRLVGKIALVNFLDSHTGHKSVGSLYNKHLIYRTGQFNVPSGGHLQNKDYAILYYDSSEYENFTWSAKAAYVETKLCPNGVEVSASADCATTIIQCPDGSSVNSDQNCPTKICPDQSEIPFDYTCPTDSDSDGDGNGNGNGNGFDITPLLAKQDKIIENQGKSLENQGKSLENQGKSLENQEKSLENQEKFLENQQYSINETNNLKTHLSSEYNPAKTNVDGSVGFYQPQYVDGLQTVLDKHNDIFEQSEVNEYMQKWNVEAHGDKPDMNFCFDIPDVGDLGCHELKIDNYVFAFMRIILIVTSLFAARFIVFGG